MKLSSLFSRGCLCLLMSFGVACKDEDESTDAGIDASEDAGADADAANVDALLVGTEDPAICGTPFVPAAPGCGTASDGASCEDLEAKIACLAEQCATTCGAPCLVVQTGNAWSCEGDNGAECISEGYFFCACAGIEPPLPSWTPGCEDDAPAACGTVTDLTGAECGSQADGASCVSLEAKEECLTNACEATCELSCVSLRTGGELSCTTEGDAGPECRNVGYVYCPCAEHAIDPEELFSPACVAAMP